VEVLHIVVTAPPPRIADVRLADALFLWIQCTVYCYRHNDLFNDLRIFLINVKKLQFIHKLTASDTSKTATRNQ